MTGNNYREIADKVGARSGWDFSSVKLKVEEEERNWDYKQVVEDFVSPDQILLDLCTGGGEFLLTIADQVAQAYGIDVNNSMIRTARENLEEVAANNVKFKVADSEDLPFPSNKFDIAICKQAPVSATELARVLKEGGVFITQQVRENDKENIKDVFGRGQNFERETDELLQKTLRHLKQAGFTIERQDTYNATTYLKSRKDLIQLLTWAPIIPDFNLSKEENRRCLEQLENNFKTENGVKTNTSRFLIIAHS